MIKDYYQQFDPAKQYSQLLFRASKGLQSRELNDLQLQSQHHVKGIADVLMKDGDVVKGGDVVVDNTQQRATIGASSVYLQGAVHDVPTAQLAIRLDKLEVVGVWLAKSVVTELHDPALRDPAIGAHNFDEAGAARLKISGVWGLSDSLDYPDSDFFPVYQIDHGTLIVKQPPPQLDSITSALARYDRESNGGSYVVSGLNVSYRQTSATHQHFNVQEGKAHINGYEIAFNTALPVALANDPDVREVINEPSRFIANDQGKMRIDLDFAPVQRIDQVTAEVKKRTELTRGHAQTGQNTDPFDDDSVIEIMAISQNGVEYRQGIDFIFVRNHISWRDGGDKPASGTTYDVIYTYRRAVEVNADETGFWLEQHLNDAEEVLENGLIVVDYHWYMPRIDLLVLTPSGSVERIKGAPDRINPQAPLVPHQHLGLAQVHQHWGSAPPQIQNIAIEAVQMTDLALMQQQISDLYQLLAIERLRNDTTAQTPASKYGVFVDPFLDDDMRDVGLSQSGSIVDGELMLPMSADVTQLAQTQTLSLPFELEDVLVQESRTGEMKINPYMAFEPIPADVTLTPSVDHWTQTQTQWTSPITRRLTQGGGRVRRVVEHTTTERVGVRRQQAEFLRSRWVDFAISGFDSGEQLDSLLFDGIEIISEVQA
ncbi:DUF4815 domain-containing protein [Pseudoalteromonas peptidolytica]|uniref:DUF4815 domain-containing protein n=1 Tax=Pseudoalteromonas peptidolytica F12-50-A1 TaxID=1315280 RepID=A0A8I0MX94_9GAMM|nr:DUF4815 domain-containing protein [Pseudoalteromonas peptidolytica]MBE0347038.1 hypothetical protein [Pseudoalteromonas peptidolytica F12-50-A1]NLR14092.1 DUF4815 domain-containing protein [Pseudoalteromonas peptidolytica]GEK09140.1 hypothetical protein PPE03_13890 [Pseudoalteromonas peptidolytica]